MTVNIPHMETIKNTAKLFKPYGITENFIRQKVLSGEIVSVKAGCKYLVNIDKLTEYLNTHHEGNHAEEIAAEQGGIQPIPVNL